MPDQHRVWERIAASFDASRQRPWSHVEAFIKAAPRPVLDLMCGNGRHLRPGVVGVDWSRPLCRLAARRGDAVAGGAEALPFPDGTFGAAVCVAGLHGIPAAAGRDAALRELARVLRPGAAAQITVWSRHAPRFAALPDDQVDVVVPWRSGGLDEARTVHLYTPGTLQDAVVAAGLEPVSMEEVAIAASRPDNLVAVARRR